MLLAVYHADLEAVQAHLAAGYRLTRNVSHTPILCGTIFLYAHRAQHVGRHF